MTTRAATAPPPDQLITDLLTRITGDEKHDAAATSTLDVLRVLYADVLDCSPERMDDPDRDRFYLSKGHGPAAYYAVLAAHGYFSPDWLTNVGSYDSPLGWHPDRMLVPGVEISSGSLGHGLPLAVGSALGLRAQGRRSHIFVLVGDAELDEGSNAEAIELAAALHLTGVTTIVIDNSSSSYAVPGRIGQRFGANGWAVHEVDGRDHAQLRDALRQVDAHRPSVVVAHVEAKA